MQRGITKERESAFLHALSQSLSKTFGVLWHEAHVYTDKQKPGCRLLTGIGIEARKGDYLVCALTGKNRRESLAALGYLKSKGVHVAMLKPSSIQPTGLS